MSNIEKIRQEIDNSIKAFEFNGGIYDSYEAGELSAYKEILAFINSLPEEKPSKDLEMPKDTMSNEEIDKWVEAHIVVPPDDEISEARRSIYADIVPSIIEWGKRIAHKFFMKGVAEGRRLEREDREENKRKEDELPRFYGD